MIEPISTGNEQSRRAEIQNTSLDSLVASTRGDFASQCMLAMCNSKNAEYRIESKNVKLLQQRRTELKKHLEKFIKEQKKAQHSSGVLGLVSKIAGGIITAVGAVVSVYFPPAGLAISLGGIALAGGLEAGSVYYENLSTTASIGQIRTENLINISTTEQNDTIDAMKTIARYERNMSKHLVDLGEKLHQNSTIAQRS